VSRKKEAATSECASVAGHFDGHAKVLKQCTWHCPMQHVPGHTRCPWKPPSGGYLLCITPSAAARGTEHPPMLAILGHGVAPVRYRTHLPKEEVHGPWLHYKPLPVTSIGHASLCILCFFHRQYVETGAKQKDGP